MSYILGVIILVFGLVASIALHELGHFIPAKRFGILTPQYMIGFGPTIWSKKIGETEYGVKWILLGGYVHMVGMYAPGRVGRKITNRKGELTWAEQARQEAVAEIPSGQESRAFYARPVWQRLVVMLSGILMNLALSLLCVGIALGAIGYAAPSLRLAEVSAGSPAAQAGMQVGDKIVGIDGSEVSDWAAVQQGIGRTLPGKPARIAVQRGSERLELSVTPRESGGRSVIGVLPASQRYRATPGDILKYEWAVMVATSKILVALPVKLWETTLSLFETEKPRDPNSVMGIVGMGQIAGQIASTKAPGFTLADRVASFLLMMGSLNLTLFLFNLIPLMPLDGGQAAGAVFEQLRRWWCRLRGHPDPGPVDLARVLPLTAAVVVAFIGMTVLLIVADIVKPV
ncbi:M50 family metallopeptidase [Mobiluncus mulieris]|uniref:Site-2 protease family protein n=1 Tax=Mobiluncus mulieris TaxID=2052 RepID=A0A7Y0TXT0_9ACTO|nr:site-2 protease family protein [Mobiluncus mulieris]MCU9969366.1 site-2 protease family protein [Mobiluncus mulieris]MCU9973804.1 site-2 protease family protein [Mobiluncus mulieris]MCV0009809.1 site-2 protease family protein [Mobiluncus mulieris]NMW61059.1 site-2 protease family protein [Mobiluncus mulieris]NMW75510.1 site-2 protease family protein [Mobiluncus mulieris]